jgi:anti-anti-sigma factor
MLGSPHVRVLRSPTIDVDLRPAGRPGFAAALRLHGEHALSTRSNIERALRSLEGNVLVDLSDCDFIDSSVMNTLVFDAQRRELDEHLLELVVSEGNHRVALALQLTSLDQFFTVHEPLALEGCGGVP